MPQIEDWCREIETDHLVITILPDRVITAALTDKGVQTREFWPRPPRGN